MAPLWLTLALGCSSKDAPTESVAASSQELSTRQLADVLGFENRADWSSPTSAALSLSPVHVQGKSSLQVGGSGWQEVLSVPLTSLGVGPVRSVSFDVRPPVPPTSPWWLGETQLLIDVPSQGIWRRYIDRYDLARARAGEFNTITFQIPDDVATKLGGAYSDLVFRIVLSTPAGSAPYQLDNLRMNGAAFPQRNGAAACPAFVRTLSNGSLRYELVTNTRRSVVELVQKKNGVDTTRNITASEQALLNGTFSYTLTDPKTAFTTGDALSVRFRSRAVGSNADILNPGPDPSKFSDTLTYDALYSCQAVVDSDGDGIADKVDGCPGDGKKAQPGFCGCGQADVNSDGDTTPDCKDQCPADANKTVPGDCGCAGAYAPAGTACTDGPCTGKYTCNGTGQCGSALACAIPGTVGLPKDYRVDDRIYLLVPNNMTTFSEVGRLAPPGYSRLEPSSAQENLTVAAQLLKHYGQSSCVWTSGVVTAPGVISSVPRSGQPGTVIWDEKAPTRNVGNAYVNFAPSQPVPGVSSGCVAMSGDGLWRVEDCSKSCFMVYERSARSLVAKADPASFKVSCADFPGIVCDPRDGYDPADEACVPANGALPGTDLEIANQVTSCNDCLKTGQDCAASCQGVAAAPSGGRSCAADAPAQVCRVRPTEASKLCTGHNECDAGQLCGVYSYTLRVGVDPPSRPWLESECHADATGIPSRCTTVRICGTPTEACDTSLPTPAGEPDCGSSTCACGETKVCTVENPVGNWDPLAPAANSHLDSTTFDPAKVFTTIPEPIPAVIRNDEPTIDPKTGQHSWCELASAPQSQSTTDNKDGHSGHGSALELDFDPNLDLRYNLKPLAQGDLDFDLRATVSFSAKANFKLKDVTAHVDIVDAQIGAIAERCRLETLAKLDVFGLDFIPLVERKLGTGPLARVVPDDPKKCERAVAAFREIADRTKKAMRDAQELLKQYYDGLRSQQCLDAGSVCRQLMDLAPPGFPKLSCSGNIAIEDVVNSFIWNYERQIDATLALPESLRNLSFDMTYPGAPDTRLPNPKFPKVPDLSKLTPELSIPSLPDLTNAQVALLDRAKLGRLNFAGTGCSADKVQTERRTLLTVNFFLGPIPMLLEVEGVLKYGINYGVDFDFQPQNLLTSSKAKASVASVKAFAEPCAGAGIALFVGAGFRYGSFRASAGVEGMVNLVTLSMPAHAGASIEAAREQVKVVDPQVEKFVAELSTDPDKPRAVRYVARELAGLWDGTTFPLYRQKVYLGYDYGARIQAADVLTGKLSVTASVKFWFYKKKWRTTLVNFGNEGHPFERSLLRGHGELDVASGPFPWVTLDMPDAFVKFRQLKLTPPEFVGWKFADLIGALRSRGGANSIPTLRLPDLSRLELTLGDLTAIRLPEADVRGIASLLNLSFEELKLRLQSSGANLGDLRLADLARLNLSLLDFANWPLSDDYLLALDIDLPSMLKLGFDLSNLSLGKLGLSQKPDHAECASLASLSRVGGFFYDNFCRKPEAPALNELVAIDDVRPDVPAGVEGKMVQRVIENKFPGRIERADLTVLLESGTFDDFGDAVAPSGELTPVSQRDVGCGGLNPVVPTDLTSLSTVRYDAIKDETTVAFTLRATDFCRTFVGWTGLKVRYVQFAL